MIEKRIELRKCAEYVKDKMSASLLTPQTYISTDNMLPDKGGIVDSEFTPSTGKVTAFKRGDILISNIRPYFKKIWLATFDGGCCADVLVIRSNSELSNEYLYYVLSQDVFFDYVMDAKIGSKMPRGDKDHIMLYPVPILGEEERNTLVRWFGTLDKKIYENNKMIQSLSDLSKMVFSHWFLQFDFPNHEGKPYKSSGGEMYWNDSLNEEIPVGWDCETIETISKRVKVGFVGTIDPFYCANDSGFPIIRPAEMTNNGIDYEKLRHVTEEFYNENRKSQVHKGDILISRCGKEGIPNIYESDEPAQVLNAVMIEPDSDKASSIFISELLSSNFAQEQIENGTGGSVQDVVNTEIIGAIKLPFSEDVCKDYHDKMKDIYKLTMSLKDENRQLISYRDFMLPLIFTERVTIN